MTENPESPEKNLTKSDPHDELLNCLEVLADYVDSVCSCGECPDECVRNEELETACWQTVELVQVLLHEHQSVVRLMNDLIQATQIAVEEQNKGRSATKLIVAAAGTDPRIERPEWRAAQDS